MEPSVVKAVDKSTVILECNVTMGNPSTLQKVRWYLGGELMKELPECNYTTFENGTQDNGGPFCVGVDPSILKLESEKHQKKTSASPPSFIQNLIPYQGILYNSKNISLTCRVECWPICSIVWYIDGKQLDKTTSSLYYIRTEIHPSNVAKNDFESVESTLVWNLDAWPQHQLDKSAPNTKYTCLGFANGIGPGISSSSEVAVDYAPEDVGVFYKDQTFIVPNHVINVVEGQPLTPVKCIGKGHPTPTFLWKKNDTAEHSKSDTLQLTSLTRYDSGSYVCEASNKHGITAVKTYFNVQYVPECSVTMIQKDGKPTLVCTAVANPQEVSFTWRVEEYNETYVETENIVQEGLKSYLFLDSTVDTARTYFCYTNNSVGTSNPCERSVAGARPWWSNMEEENKIITIIASSAVLILCVLIVCIIIIILCRRKRANTKCKFVLPRPPQRM
ncbi:hypothetical protein WA026_014616 [Henosepilachna vigintioctopunctata]|uniref:Ig-like domain-containing protein n=1 Tax=Henosepilachna vigintioctopunctata TaxID=420089 RepID=A0AAW1V6P3_9CUCU